MHINKLFFHLYCKQTKMHTRTHTYTHTETHSERGIFERQDTFFAARIYLQDAFAVSRFI